MFTLRLLREGDSVTLSSTALKEAFHARKLSDPSSEMHEFFNQRFLSVSSDQSPEITQHFLQRRARTACSIAHRQVAAESREAPAADVWGSNTSQDGRFLPAPSLCHLTGRPEFRGEQNHAGDSISEDVDEMMGFRPRSVIYCNYLNEEVSFIYVQRHQEQRMNHHDAAQSRTSLKI